MTDDFAARASPAPASRLRRFLASVSGQRARTLPCPETPRLDGARALVTGGSRGIGAEICAGLAGRGAEVTVAARDGAASEAVCTALRTRGGRARRQQIDLADLDSVVAASDALLAAAAGRPFDLVVANAGLWPRTRELSPQGHELAFATNVLGHHLLLRRLLARAGLRADARVVVVTGDIYFLASACTPDFAFRGPWGGQTAYARSKLGNLWQVAELTRRFPRLTAVAVHPGVVRSGLGGPVGPIAGALRRGLTITPELGAQTPLFCATQPVERGAYYHNTLGRVALPPGDPALDEAGAAALWDVLERLSAAHL